MVTTEQIKSIRIGERFQVQRYGIVCRAEKESEDTLFVYAPNKRRSGWRMYAYSDGVFRGIDKIISYPKTEMDKNTQWRRKLKRVLQTLEESGLWENYKEVLTNLLNSNITFNEREEILVKYYNAHTPEDRQKLSEFITNKGYGFMLYKTEDGLPHINTNYLYGVSDAQTKSMYFGKYRNATEKERIKEAIANNRKYTISHLPVSYDVSFEYDPIKNAAWYSEEYRGCGNGHYYIALNHSTALFMESD